MVRHLCLTLVLVASVWAQEWRDWRAVFLAGRDEEPRLARALAEQGWDGVLSPSTTLVAFHDFSQFEVIPVSRLSSRLHPTDPRLDPFLRNVHRLFDSGHDGYWIYVHRSRWDRGFSEWLDRNGFRWHTPGTHLQETRVPQLPLALALYTVFLLVYLRGMRRVFLPWMAVLWGLGVGYLFLMSERGLVGLYALATFLIPALRGIRRQLESQQREGRVGNPFVGIDRRSYILPVLGLLSLLPSEGGALLILGEFLLFAGLGAGVLMLAARLWRAQLACLEHRLFVPLELNRAASPMKDGRRPLLALSTALPLLLFSPYERVVLAPPWEAESRPAQWSPAEALAQEQNGGIPGPRLYLAHLVFQEGFPYGVEFGTVEPRPLVQPFYRRDGIRILEESRVVLPYDAAWLRKAIQRTGEPGLAQLVGVGDTAFVLVPKEETRSLTGLSLSPMLALLGLAVYHLVITGVQLYVRRQRRLAEKTLYRRQAA